MDIRGTVRREGGQWKIHLDIPEWVSEDMLRDSEMGTRTVVMAVLEVYAHAGSSAYGSEAPIIRNILGTTAFEVIETKAGKIVE